VESLRQIWPRYQKWRQEDSHEFLVILLDTFIKACFRSANVTPASYWKFQEHTPIYKIFGGKLRSQVHCLSCDYKSSIYEPLCSISLDLTKHSSFQECFNDFCSSELLSGQNAYFCEKCKKKV